MRPEEEALKLMREVGIYGLGGNEGCPCTDFKVHGIAVSVSCHKSSKTVSVYGTPIDFIKGNGDDVPYYVDTERLRPIAEEVLRQVDAYYDAGGEYARTFSVSYQKD